ncbi:MAG TPA: histidine kinase [Puia sp.]|nr:histidine kinase [Puia sp.]
MRHLLPLPLLSVLLCGILHAQPRAGDSYTHYSRLEGLSNSAISGIVQDSLGFIWIATAKGLNRFDGRFFTSYYAGSPEIPLPGNEINQLKMQDGELIGSTTGGAFSYNPTTHRYLSLVVPVDSILFFWANNVFETSRNGGKGYAVSTKTGFFAFDSTGAITARHDRYKAAAVGREELLFGGSLYLPGDGSVLQENSEGFARYDPVTHLIDTDYLAHNVPLRHAVFDEHGHHQLTYIEHHNELFIFNPERNTLDIFRFRDNHLFSLPMPIDGNHELDGRSAQIAVLNDTLLAIISKSTGFYLMRYDQSNQQLRLLGTRRLDSLQCTSILLDHDGRLWVGTNEGLYKENLSNPEFKAYDLAGEAPEIRNCLIRTVMADHNNVFVGLWNLGGILVLDKNTLSVQHHVFLGRKDSLSNDIDFFIPFDADTIWVGTRTGLFWLNKNNFHSGRVPTPPDLFRLRSRNGLSHAEDHSGHIWLSFGGFNHVQRYDRATRQFTELSGRQYPLMRITHCFTMAEDKDGNMWFGGDGFCRWNAAKQDIDTLIPFPSVVSVLRNFVTLLDCDGTNNLWLYARENGIVSYNINNGHMVLAKQENDLTDGQIRAGTPIIQDKIWFAAENGVLAFSIKDQSVRIFSYGESVPTMAITTLANHMIYDEEANCFFLGSRRYLITFRPQLQTSPETKPRLFIDVISTSHGLLPLKGDQAELHYPDNGVTIRLDAVNFSNPEGNRFAWRVTPSADTGWHLLNGQQSISFSDLAPGAYHVRLKLFSANNRWPEQYKDLLLQVYPPFWKSWWFLSLVAVAVFASITLLYRNRLSRVREKLKLDKQVAEYEMKALHAQMNPHFIFNALNSIREMILLDDNRNASRYLSRFARLIRLNLEHSKLTFISLQQNIDYLESYLEMEQLRFPDFSFRIDVSSDLDRNEVRLAPMLIQPLVENAIWHGLLPKGDDKWVHIRFFHEAGQLICEIEDNGIGIRESLNKKTTGQNPHRSVGISNIQERIAVLNEKYRIRCSLVIRDKTDIPGQTGTGTIITLIFPAHEEELIG